MIPNVRNHRYSSSISLLKSARCSTPRQKNPDNSSRHFCKKKKKKWQHMYHVQCTVYIKNFLQVLGYMYRCVNTYSGATLIGALRATYRDTKEELYSCGVTHKAVSVCRKLVVCQFCCRLIQDLWRHSRVDWTCHVAGRLSEGRWLLFKFS